MADYEDEVTKRYACELESAQASLRQHDPDHPKLIFCEPDVFKFGAIAQDYPGAHKVVCQTCYPRVSKRMEVFGTVVLHEYIHWEKLASPVLKGPFGLEFPDDVVCGCWDVRQLSKEDARDNADSYAWLATEVFWRYQCEGSFGPIQDPTEEDC